MRTLSSHLSKLTARETHNNELIIYGGIVHKGSYEHFSPQNHCGLYQFAGCSGSLNHQDHADGNSGQRGNNASGDVDGASFKLSTCCSHRHNSLTRFVPWGRSVDAHHDFSMEMY
jgi:hypothetical protein